jgi:transcriptional regulator with XRE-family HTH domain
MMTEESLGTRLRRSRLEAGETQEQAAHAIGCTLGAWRNWERDRRRPGMSYLVRVAFHYGWTISDLLTSDSDTRVWLKPIPSSLSASLV